MKKITEMNDKMKAKYADLFINALDSMEKSAWTMPWVSPNQGIPCNLYRQNKPYSGINHFLLTLLCKCSGFETPYFVTFKEMTGKEKKFGGLSLNASIKTGEDGLPKFKDNGEPVVVRPGSFPVFKYLPNFKDKDGNKLSMYEYEQLDESEKEEVKKWFSLFVYGVWNIDQTNFKDLYPEEYEKMTKAKDHTYEHGKTDVVLDRMIMRGEWRCPILFGGRSAHYSPSEDHIRLPKRENFLSDELFYAAAIHEMAHSTGKELKREKGGMFGSEKYAMEEFVAELTSACVCSMLGIGKLLDEQHLAYVDNWRKAIRSEENFVPQVIDHVQRATNYILKYYNVVSKKINGPLLLAA